MRRRRQRRRLRRRLTRQKLQKRSPGWSYIHTHFGVGYRFDPEPAAGTAEAAVEAAVESAPAPEAELASQAVHNTFTPG